MRAAVLVPLSVLLLACGARSTDPAPTSGGAAATSSDASVAAQLGRVGLVGGWTRLAWLEGKWVTPPESGTLPPVEVRAEPPTLQVRSGAGEQKWTITAVRADRSATVLDLRGADGATAEARFVAWAAAGVEAPGAPPPAGAWAVALPGRAMVGDVAWYRED